MDVEELRVEREDLEMDEAHSVVGSEDLVIQ